ncbi:hypothetical protein [Photobacterium kishitanii]|nr:hypothetical protein [Photobacterium kishitanii]
MHHSFFKVFAKHFKKRINLETSERRLMKIPNLKQILIGSAAAHIAIVVAASFSSSSDTHNIHHVSKKAPIQAIAVKSEAVSSAEVDSIVDKFKQMKDAQSDASLHQRAVVEDLKRETKLRNERIQDRKSELRQLQKKIDNEKNRLEELKKKS